MARPYSILGVNVVAADTDEEARFLATSGSESFANLRRGMPTKLPPPNREFEKEVVPFGTLPLEEVHSIAIVGSASSVLEGFRRFTIAETVDIKPVLIECEARRQNIHDTLMQTSDECATDAGFAHSSVKM